MPKGSGPVIKIPKKVRASPAPPVQVKPPPEEVSESENEDIEENESGEESNESVTSGSESDDLFDDPTYPSPTRGRSHSKSGATSELRSNNRKAGSSRADKELPRPKTSKGSTSRSRDREDIPPPLPRTKKAATREDSPRPRTTSKKSSRDREDIPPHRPRTSKASIREDSPPRLRTRTRSKEPIPEDAATSRPKARKVTPRAASSGPKTNQQSERSSQQPSTSQASRSLPSTTVEGEERCLLVFTIHKIRKLGTIKYKRNHITATIEFLNETWKSRQVPKADWREKLSEYFMFEMDISREQADAYLANPDSMNEDIVLTIKVENRKSPKKRPWTHSIGSAKIPAEDDDGLDNNQWMTRLNTTDYEEGKHEVIYSMKIMMGNICYVI